MSADYTRLQTGRHLVVALAVAFLPALQGCHDWPDERTAAIETETILQDIGRMETDGDPDVPWPATHSTDPVKVQQVIGGRREWKLTYLCRHHRAEELKRIVHEQFASRLFHVQGESTTIPAYTVTAVAATNQLVVRCPEEADIDAVRELLEHVDIAPIQVRISCTVSELYSSVTVDRETTVLIENLFGENITLGGKSDEDGEVVPAFPGASLRDLVREKFGLKMGVSSGEAGHRFETLVDILVSRGYLKILMNPTLEVMNGQPARIQSKQHVPLQEVTIQTGGFGGETVLRTQTEYYDVIDVLEIIPHVYADGYVGLDVTVRISTYLAPTGVKQVPIVTSRTVVNEESRVRLGESLVIGGLRKSEKFGVTRGVPVLKDVPIVKHLFSGKDFEERASEVFFVITPTVSTTGEARRARRDAARTEQVAPLPESGLDRLIDGSLDEVSEPDWEDRASRSQVRCG